MTKRRPWFKFHTQDWRADPALRMCSPAARGLWADMLSLMHEADPYGHLLIGGIAPSDKQLARLLSIDETLIGSLIGDLSDNGVFSRTDAGVIFSRRMVRDAETSDEGRANIAKRWGNEAKSRGVTSSPNRPPNRVPIEKNDTDPITKSQSQKSDNHIVSGAVVPIPVSKAMIEGLIDRAGEACDRTAPGVHHGADLNRFVRGGCDWVADIEPAVDQLAASFLRRNRRFATWALLEEHAVTNRDRRLAGIPTPSKPTEKTNGRNGSSPERDAWDRVLAEVEGDAARRSKPPVALGG